MEWCKRGQDEDGAVMKTSLTGCRRFGVSFLLHGLVHPLEHLFCFINSQRVLYFNCQILGPCSSMGMGANLVAHHRCMDGNALSYYGITRYKSTPCSALPDTAPLTHYCRLRELW